MLKKTEPVDGRQILLTHKLCDAKTCRPIRSASTAEEALSDESYRRSPFDGGTFFSRPVGRHVFVRVAVLLALVCLPSCDPSKLVCRVHPNGDVECACFDVPGANGGFSGNPCGGPGQPSCLECGDA